MMDPNIAKKDVRAGIQRFESMRDRKRDIRGNGIARKESGVEGSRIFGESSLRHSSAEPFQTFRLAGIR